MRKVQSRREEAVESTISADGEREEKIRVGERRGGGEDGV